MQPFDEASTLGFGTDAGIPSHRASGQVTAAAAAAATTTGGARGLTANARLADRVSAVLRVATCMLAVALGLVIALIVRPAAAPASQRRLRRRAEMSQCRPSKSPLAGITRGCPTLRGPLALSARRGTTTGARLYAGSPGVRVPLVKAGPEARPQSTSRIGGMSR